MGYVNPASGTLVRHLSRASLLTCCCVIYILRENSEFALKLDTQEAPQSGNRLQSRARRVGLRDVAELAGVSVASVSRVLNDPDRVAESTRAGVRQAIHELGYIPDGNARALSRQRSDNVGAIVPTIDNAIFAGGIEALQKRLNEQGYNLLLATSGYDPAAEYHQCRNLVMSGVGAIWFMGETHLPETYALLQQHDVRYVNTGTYAADPPHPCVGFDNRAAAARASNYLLDLGHSRIGVLAGIRRDNDRAANRVRGVSEAMAARGLDLPADRIVEQPYTLDGGAQGLRILMSGDQPPTAIFCGNDVLACGAALEAPRLGLRVPADLSIVGFDDLELASHVEPNLTTVRVPTAEMGRKAADYLIGALEGRDVPRATEIKVSLIVRDSTAPPPAPR